MRVSCLLHLTTSDTHMLSPPVTETRSPAPTHQILGGTSADEQEVQRLLGAGGELAEGILALRGALHENKKKKKEKKGWPVTCHGVFQGCPA